jgi:hypothetical protein
VYAYESLGALKAKSLLYVALSLQGMWFTWFRATMVLR